MTAVHVLLSAIAALAVWSFVVEPRWLKIRNVRIRLERPLRAPLTVLHVSDSHFPLHKKTLNRFFKTLSEKFRPDLVVLTGDLIENDRGIDDCARAVASLRGKFGTYAVFGNHDHYEYNAVEIVIFLFTRGRFPVKRNNVEELRRRLEEGGCRVLMNESVELDIAGGKIALIGLDDPVTRRGDFGKALANVGRPDAAILLTHTLDALPKANGFPIDLALGGHTHGGQVALPFIGALPLKAHSNMGRKYVAGLCRYKNTITYTSRGIGEGKFFAFRFLCRPEAVLFEIQ